MDFWPDCLGCVKLKIAGQYLLHSYRPQQFWEWFNLQVLTWAAPSVLLAPSRTQDSRLLVYHPTLARSFVLDFLRQLELSIGSCFHTSYVCYRLRNPTSFCNKTKSICSKKFRCTWKLLIEEWWLKKPNEERKITQRIPTQNPKKTKNKIILTKNKNFQSINGLQVVMICKKCQIFSNQV